MNGGNDYTVQGPNSMGVQYALTFVIDVLPHVTSKCHVKLAGHLLQELNATRDIQFLWSAYLQMEESYLDLCLPVSHHCKTPTMSSVILNPKETRTDLTATLRMNHFPSAMFLPRINSEL